MFSVYRADRWKYFKKLLLQDQTKEALWFHYVEVNIQDALRYNALLSNLGANRFTDSFDVNGQFFWLL